MLRLNPGSAGDQKSHDKGALEHNQQIAGARRLTDSDQDDHRQDRSKADDDARARRPVGDPRRKARDIADQ